MSAAAAGAAYHNQLANAIKACGTLVTVGPIEFTTILAKTDNPLVIWSEGGLFLARWLGARTHFKYLTSYRGLAFYCKSQTPLQLPKDAEIIAANRISMPDL